MKANLLKKAIAFAIVMSTCYNCSVESIEQPQEELHATQIESQQLDDPAECIGENPKSRITNNSTSVVNFEIHDANGTLVSYVYGLNPDEVSDWKSFPVGVTTFTVSTSETSKPVTIDMGLCMSYDVAINENNQLDTDVPNQL